MKAKSAKSHAKAKPAKAKAARPKSGGLLGKLRGALSKKPAGKPVAKSHARPAAKPVAAKAKAAAHPKPVAKPMPAKATAHPRAVSPPRATNLKSLPNEDQVRRMHDRDYMNDSQLEFFRQRLLQMREEVLARELDVKERLHQREIFADPADRATAEEEHWLDLRLREREAFLLRKIDDALRRIENREYGYCEKTGDPIGIPRLLARPTATVCVDVKGQDERVEAQFRDR